MCVTVEGICCNSYVYNRKWVIDSRENHHMTNNESRLNIVGDVSKLDLRVDRPNCSSTKVNKFGNMDLSESLTLFDDFDNGISHQSYTPPKMVLWR